MLHGESRTICMKGIRGRFVYVFHWVHHHAVAAMHWSRGVSVFHCEFITMLSLQWIELALCLRSTEPIIMLSLQCIEVAFVSAVFY